MFRESGLGFVAVICGYADGSIIGWLVLKSEVTATEYILNGLALDNNFTKNVNKDHKIRVIYLKNDVLCKITGK